MRILGRTDDSFLNRYDFCFLGMMPLPFDLPLGGEVWPRPEALDTKIRLNATARAVVRLGSTSATTAIRLDGDASTE